MAKITKITRAYITIEIEEPRWDRQPNDWGNRARKSLDLVQRLLRASGFDHLGNINVETEFETICTLCGCLWWKEDNKPMCCKAAQAEWKAKGSK